MTSALGRNIEAVLSKLDLHSEIPLNDDISLDPSQFYDELGHLKHPRTGQEVTYLTDYQIEVWKALLKWKRILVVKSNKIGLSTSTLMADFQLALLPSTNPLSCRGHDQLLIAQTIAHAREHLYTLRKMILNSEKYGKYLVTKSTELLLRDEVTKVTALFIRNPEHENLPSRIIGLGLNNAGAILSWKNIKHVHISDPTAAEGDYTEALNAAMTRLANTNGSMVIESVPSGPSGKLYEMYQQFKGLPDEEGQFKVFEIPADAAVRAGIITQEFLDQERDRLGVLYPQYYEAKFIAGTGNIFSTYMVDLCIQQYELTMGANEKILAVDPAFGSSKFAVLGVEKINDIWYVKEAKQFDRPSTSVMIDMIAGIMRRDGYSVCYVDSAHPGLIQDWSNGSSDGSRGPITALPVNFRQDLNSMVPNAVKAVKEQRIRIHPAFTDLITQLKTVQYNEHGHPDKKRVSFDLGDCLMMSLSNTGSGPIGSGWSYSPSNGGRF